MATTTGQTAFVTIYDPIITINAVDVGFISDKLEFTYGQTIAQYSSGVPKSLRKALKTEEKATIKCELMESSLGNFQSALNLPSTAVSSTSILKAGGTSSVNVLTSVKFVGTGDDGKTMSIELYKAIIIEPITLNIDMDFMKIPVVFEAVADLSRASGDTLFRIIRVP